MEIAVNFVCPCGAFVEEIIYADGPDLMAEQNQDSYRESWEILVCDGCSKDFEVHVQSAIFETKVSVVGAVDLSWEILPEPYDFDVWEIETTKQLEIYKKVTNDIVALLRMDVPNERRSTLHNMLYAQVVTAIEAYLSGIFIHTVINSEQLIRKLVESDPDLAKRQFSLKEIFTQWEELKFLVARYLKDLIFHDIKKIKPMYHSVLGIDFGDVSWLFKAVLIRHDCVHRNGFDKDGKQNEINSGAIIDLVKSCTALVAAIEEEIFANHKI